MKRFMAAVFASFFFVTSAYADIGRIQTRRERMKKESAATPDADLQAIHERFLSGDYERAEILASRYAASHARSAETDQVRHIESLCQLENGRYAQARRGLAALEADSADPSVQSAAAVSLGDSFYLEKDFVSANAAYARAASKYPSAPESAYLAQRLRETAPPAAASKAGVLKQLSVEEKPFFSVQVGSFSQEKNAEALVRKLIYHNHDAYLNAGADGFYRVRVGHFAVKSEAARLESRLKKEGYPTTIVS